MKEDVIGQKFGRWTILSLAQRCKGLPRSYLCECECGEKRIVIWSSLRNNRSKSCGCYHKEVMSGRSPWNRSHQEGLIRGEGGRLYRIWAGMKSRCYNPNRKKYTNYGARGIRVCDEWQEYLSFKQWALKNGYDKSLSIDRLNNDGNYEPTNCRWATPTQQAENTTRSRLVTINGVTKNVSRWIREDNMPKSWFYKKTGEYYQQNRPD